MERKKIGYLFISMLMMASVAEAQTAADRLSLELQKGIKTLSQDTRFYNYFNINLNGYRLEQTTLKDESARINYSLDRLKVGGKTFRDFNRRSTQFSNAGPGIYLAVDPFASSPSAAQDSGANFGDTIVEAKLRAGTKYLSVFAPFSLSKETVNALIAEGYLTGESAQRVLTGNRVSRDTFKFMVGYGLENFRKLMADTLRNQNVLMIEYAWQSGVSALCGWKDLRSAFVYISEETPYEVAQANLIIRNGFPSSVVRSTSELEALDRVNTMHPLLQKLRILEKRMKATKGTVARQSIRNEVTQEIQMSLSDSWKLQDIKAHTFKCF